MLLEQPVLFGSCLQSVPTATAFMSSRTRSHRALPMLPAYLPACRPPIAGSSTGPFRPDCLPAAKILAPVQCRSFAGYVSAVRLIKARSLSRQQQSREKEKPTLLMQQCESPTSQSLRCWHGNLILTGQLRDAHAGRILGGNLCALLRSE